MGALLDRADLGLVEVDALGVVTDANGTAHRRLGRAELRGLGWLDLAAGATGDLQRWLDGAPAQSPPLCWTLRGRALRALLLGASAEARWIAILDDTEHQALGSELDMLRRAVDRLEALALAEHAAAALAHDLNNLLQVVVGLAEMAHQKNDETMETLLETSRQATRLSRLLLETGRPRLDAPPRCQPRAVIEEIAPILSSLLSGRLRLDLDEVGWAGLPAPALVRVVLNLAANARDATQGRGQVSLGVRAERDEIRVEVRDSGSGMSPEVLRRARELAFTTKPNGNGLGLALVQRIVKRHGGRLELESELGRGTTAAVVLPRLGPAELDPTQPTDRGETSTTTE